MTATLHVLHVSDESGVATALAAALGAQASVSHLPVRQVGAHWPSWAKPAAILPRYRDAVRIRAHIDNLQPRPDVLHIHWLPNGLIGAVGSRNGPPIPWVLHIHGSDVRGVGGWRLLGYRRLLRDADAVVFSTPDLAAPVRRWRPDAEWIPVPIHVPAVKELEARWDVLAASAAIPIKGSRTAFAALRLIAAESPATRMAATEGAAYETGPWVQLAHAPHDAFLHRLQSSRVIVGQLKLGAVGVVELEAMALGRAVVGFVDESFYPEPPPIVSAKSAREVSAAVLRLLERPQVRASIGASGRDWVAAHHDPSTIAGHMLRIYERIRSGEE